MWHGMLNYDYWTNGWMFVSKFKKSFNNLDIKALYSIISKVKDRFYFDYRDLELSFDDQQLTLLSFCVLILFFNVGVICYIWRKSRRSIIKKFKKRGKYFRFSISFKVMLITAMLRNSLQEIN